MAHTSVAKMQILQYHTLSFAGLNKPAASGIALCASKIVKRPPRPGFGAVHRKKLLVEVRSFNCRGARRHEDRLCRRAAVV